MKKTEKELQEMGIYSERELLLSGYSAMLRPGSWGLHCALSTC
jgi:hypothetical protein